MDDEDAQVMAAMAEVMRVSEELLRRLADR
jgi:hypothetical protein